MGYVSKSPINFKLKEIWDLASLDLVIRMNSKRPMVHEGYLRFWKHFMQKGGGFLHLNRLFNY